MKILFFLKSFLLLLKLLKIKYTKKNSSPVSILIYMSFIWMFAFSFKLYNSLSVLVSKFLIVFISSKVKLLIYNNKKKKKSLKNRERVVKRGKMGCLLGRACCHSWWTRSLSFSAWPISSPICLWRASSLRPLAEYLVVHYSNNENTKY